MFKTLYPLALLAFPSRYGLTFTHSFGRRPDFRGNGGWHWFIGPEAGVVVGAGGSLEAIFFPKVNLESFAGWGSGIGGSAGAVATFNMDGMWDGSVKEFQGFGIGGGGGVGSKMVGSLAASYTHAWKIGK